jgi:hypothetical protein
VNAWLIAVPSKWPIDSSLENDEMRALLNYHLGLKQQSDLDAMPRCCYCHREQDRFGHHALSCNQKGHIVKRHNRLRNTFQRLCNISGLTTEAEQGSHASDHTRPADLLIKEWVNVLRYMY